VLFEAVYPKCLAGQTAGKLPGTDEVVCLNNPDWLKVKAVVKACVAPGKVEAKCPAASERGPKPRDGCSATEVALAARAQAPVIGTRASMRASSDLTFSRTGCINGAVKGHDFSRAEKAA